mmetsp:Transcript_8938/g.11226  ORF Transcript_8938/g.11226 Transcript_8938/m.11226 type:complete len:81 (-) Transcript_8938:541-783(-)
MDDPESIDDASDVCKLSLPTVLISFGMSGVEDKDSAIFNEDNVDAPLLLRRPTDVPTTFGEPREDVIDWVFIPPNPQWLA